MSKKKGAKGCREQKKNSDCFESNSRYRKPSWFEQHALMINHEIPE
jgi:hypothetical protein